MPFTNWCYYFNNLLDHIYSTYFWNRFEAANIYFGGNRRKPVSNKRLWALCCYNPSLLIFRTEKKTHLINCPARTKRWNEIHCMTLLSAWLSILMNELIVFSPWGFLKLRAYWKKSEGKRYSCECSYLPTGGRSRLSQRSPLLRDVGQP